MDEAIVERIVGADGKKIQAPPPAGPSPRLAFQAPPPAGPSPRLNFQAPPPAGPCRGRPGYSNTGLKYYVTDKLIFNSGILLEIPKNMPKEFGRKKQTRKL